MIPIHRSTGCCQPTSAMKTISQPARQLWISAALFAVFGLQALSSATSASISATFQGNDLGEVSLQDAIELALERNFLVRVEKFNPQVAELGIQSEQGIFDPRLDASVSRFFQERDQGTDPGTGLPVASRVENQNLDVSLSGLLPFGTTYDVGYDLGNTRGEFNNFSDDYNAFAGITVRQPLLRNFGYAENMSRIRVAQVNFDLSNWAFRQTLINTVTNTITAYNFLYFAQQNLEVAVNSRDLAQRLLNENMRRVELGTMADVDTLQAASQLALREERVLNAERLYQDQKMQFLALVTGRIENLLEMDIQILPPPPQSYVASDTLQDFQKAIQNRPDYQQALLDIETREVLLARDKRRSLPSLDVFGSFGYSGTGMSVGDSNSGIGDRTFETSTIGAAFRYPIMNRTASANRVSSMLLLNQAELSLERLKQVILLDVDAAARRIATDWERIAAAQKAREVSERALEGEEKRLELGTTSSFVVLRLQSDLAEAEIRELQAIVDYNQSLAEYDRAVGLTLEKNHIETASP